MVFMYPCTCTPVSAYYVILQTSSSTHFYLSRRSTRDERTPQYSYIHIYWAKVLTDYPKNCDNVFVVQYFGMNFGTFNENTVWHQSCASAGIWHSVCSLRMRKHTKPLKCMCNSRNDLNRNSNNRNLKNNVFALK